MSLIRNVKKMCQVIDFTGLSKGSIHPTDIDVVLEFNNRFLILMELKTNNSKIPTGQRLLLERVVDAWNSNTGKKAIALYVTHNFKDPSKPIVLEGCDVKSYYQGGSDWSDSKTEVTVKECLNILAEKWNISKMKGIGNS